MCMSLVNGGAIVDFRNKLDGSTALHRTVAKSNIEALQTLLDLGMLYVKYNLNGKSKPGKGSNKRFRFRIPRSK